jgi:hypothetical protein
MQHPGDNYWFKLNMERLIAHQKTLGKNMEQLAKEIGNGCTAAWLRKIVQRGIKKPTRLNAAWLESLARILQLHVADFWDDETYFSRYQSPTQKAIDGCIRRGPKHP